MSVECLGDLLSILQGAGELVRISAPVHSANELSEIAARLRAVPGGGPAIFFENVRGSTVPVVTNLYGSSRRLCLALGVTHWGALSEKLDPALRSGPGTGAGPGAGSVSSTGSLASSARHWVDQLVTAAGGTPSRTESGTRLVKTAPVQSIVQMGRDLNLANWPIPRGWPGEPRPTITGAMTLTRHPVTGVLAQTWLTWEVLDTGRLAPAWRAGQAIWEHARAAKTLGRQLPIAIVLGGPTALPMVCGGAFPPPVDVYSLTAALQSAPLEVARCRTHDVEIPAQAEIVIEAMLDSDAALEQIGPHALSSGLYSEPYTSPSCHLTALTHRPNPIWPTVQRGPRGVGEEVWLRWAAQRLTLPALRASHPALVDWHWPAAGLASQVLFVAVEKSEPCAARQVIHGLWSQGWIGRPRWIVAVDAGVTLTDEAAVWGAVAAHADPRTDVLTTQGLLDPEDPVLLSAGAWSHAPGSLPGTRWAVDATTKLPAERGTVELPATVAMSDEIVQQVSIRLVELGLQSVIQSAASGQGRGAPR